MGEIKKLLAITTDLPTRDITARAVWKDLCENVHLHYRNFRFDLSSIEWSRFRSAINSLGMTIEKLMVENNYQEGDSNFLIQAMFNEQLPNNSDYYPNRATIELQRDNTVHMHYRDLRIHLSLAEFKILADMFEEAKIKYSQLKEFRFKDVTEESRVTLGIDEIQPYDAGHLPGICDDEHRAGIDYCKRLMATGHKIRPILVSNEGQRLDGFKRYMAHKELGFDLIECFVTPFGIMGGQTNMSMIDDE